MSEARLSTGRDARLQRGPGRVWTIEDIPPGFGAHVGEGRWVRRCPQSTHVPGDPASVETGCEAPIIESLLPVEMQNHLYEAHRLIAPVLGPMRPAPARPVRHLQEIS